MIDETQLQGDAEGDAEGDAGAPTRRRTKPRRTRTRHPGVKLIERAHRSGTTSWAARWTDPDTGLVEQLSLDKLGLTTHQARRTWAERKSTTLAARRADLATGAPRAVDKGISEAVEDYFATGQARLRARTVALYREAVATFTGWCAGQGARLTKDLSPPMLAAFREALATRPRHVVAKGGRRGERAPAAGKVPSPTTVNKRLRAVATFLTHVRRLGLTPRLSSDAIKDGLRPLKQPRPRPSCLRPAELQQLLAAALRHDADVFVVTREQNAGHGEPGTTPRYTPIAPFVAAVLLTGMRVGEAAALRTDAVLLDGAAGSGIGEIVLRSGEVKTGIERAIDLAVSPALRQLLVALKLRAGGAPYLFGGEAPLRADVIEAARRRLVGDRQRKARKSEKQAPSFGAPRFTWQMLRQTCGSYLTNAPGIFGSASAYKSARQLGHSVTVAERHYVGVIHVAPEAKALESAMLVEGQLAELQARFTGAEAPRRRQAVTGGR